MRACKIERFGASRRPERAGLLSYLVYDQFAPEAFSYGSLRESPNQGTLKARKFRFSLETRSHYETNR